MTPSLPSLRTVTPFLLGAGFILALIAAGIWWMVPDVVMP